MGTPNERLDSWKAIAAHFGRTVRTVQRWERDLGLPVHRLLHHSLSSVYAYTDDLTRWLAAREPPPTSTDATASLRRPLPERRASMRVDPAAHDCYVRARHFMDKRTAPAVQQAIREYRKALDAAPTWALPHSGIAEAYVMLTGSELKAPLDGFPKARAAARQALELDPDLASAHAVLGFVASFFDADWEGAAAHFCVAIEADPNTAVARYWSALALMNQGRFEEAHESMRRALDLDPLSAALTANAGRVYMCAGDHDSALEWLERALELDPDLWFAHLFMGFAYEGKGLYAEAIKSMETSVRLAGGSGGALGSLAHAHAKAGDQQSAEGILRDLLAPKAPYVSAVRFARVVTAFGRHDEAFMWLERACADRSIRCNTHVRYDPAFAPILSDARFSSVLRASNLS